MENTMGTADKLTTTSFILENSEKVKEQAKALEFGFLESKTLAHMITINSRTLIK
jgi:hypothetical protein